MHLNEQNKEFKKKGVPLDFSNFPGILHPKLGIIHKLMDILDFHTNHPELPNAPELRRNCTEAQIKKDMTLGTAMIYTRNPFR